MTTVYESKVVRAIREFKAQIEAQDEAQIRLLAKHYLDIEQAIEDNIVALSEQAARLYSEGADPSWSAIYRLERYQRLQAQLMEELARFNGWAASLIKDRQWQMGLQGLEDAAQVLDLARSGLGTVLEQMPHDAIRAMTGIAKNGAPLGDLLATSYPTMRTQITRELMRSVALGRNPRVTAQAIRKATNMGLDKALTIARTEQMRVYNSAALQTYRAVGVTQYQRLADYSDNTCIACLSASGQILSSESELSDHPRGKCVAIPIVDGAENPQPEDPQQWFKAQPMEVQRSIMGPGRLALYKSGDVRWSELATHTHDPVWGGSLTPTPLSALTGQAAQAA